MLDEMIKRKDKALQGEEWLENCKKMIQDDACLDLCVKGGLGKQMHLRTSSMAARDDRSNRV
jgi:hypothetical protein